MLSDKIFQTTLIISAVAHGALLFANSGICGLQVKKNLQKVEISYLKIPKKAPLQRLKVPLPKKESSLNTKAPPPFIDKENIFKDNIKIRLSSSNDLIKPSAIKPDIIAVKKKITLPPVDMDKINNASYISYYQIVREKIRRAAYQNYTRTEIGEVYLSFIVSNDGSLKQVRLVEEKSSNSPYLKEIALRCINSASPFPAFPKELDYPKLSFNVVISFEVE